MSGIRFRHWSCILLALAFCFAAMPATASSELRVVLITRTPESPATRRIQAELDALGVNVVVVADKAGSERRTRLEQIAKQNAAIAAVRVIDLGRNAEVWIADRATRKTVIREFVHSDDPGGSEDVLAVGVVELLRASLMELHVPTDTKPQTVVASEAELKRIAYPLPVKPRTPALLAMTIAPAIELGFGALDASLHGRWAFAFRPHAGFGARLNLTTAFSRPTVSDARGVAEFSSHAFAAQATYAWTILNGQVIPSVSAGMGGATVSARGLDAAPNATTQDESLWVLASLFSVSTTLRLSGNLALSADVSALYALERVEVRFLSSEVATWGRPAIFISLGIEAGFMAED